MRQPDYVLNVQQKRLSRKYSWTIHESREAANREYGNRRNPWRFRYRVNVYLKEWLR